MVENIIIAIIVACCAFYIGRRFFKQLKGGPSSCGCGCTGCDDGSNNSKNIRKGPVKDSKGNGCSNC